MLLGWVFFRNGMRSFQLLDCMQTDHFKWVILIVLRSLITLFFLLHDCSNKK